MFKYKITLKQQLLVSAHAFLTILLIISIGYFYSGGFFKSNILIAVLLLTFLIDTLPALILHIQYLVKNRKVELIIDRQNDLIVYKRISNTINFSFNDIDSVKYFVSYGRQTGVYSFAIYRYYKIILSNKTEFIVTCLMINDIENTLEMLLHRSAEKKHKFICFLPLKSFVTK
jgi:hypothetical protein